MKKFLRLLLLLLVIFISPSAYAMTNVSIESVSLFSKSDTIEVENPSLNGSTISSSISFKQLNDYVAFDIELKNNDSEKVLIQNVGDNNDNNNIELSYDYDDQYFAQNETKNLRVTMRYKNQLYNTDELDLSNI